MKSLKRHIVLFLLLIVALKATIASPWVPPAAGDTMKISFTRAGIQNKSNLQQGDIIGAFYDSAGIAKCCGIATVDTVAIHFFIYAREKTASTPGFTVGDSVMFKVYRGSENCIFENIDFFTWHPQYEVTHGTETRGVESIYAYHDTITFAPLNYNIDQSSTQDVEFRDGLEIKFRANTGLAIDSLTGIIDVGNSSPGLYTVLFDSEVCLDKASVDVTVYSALNIIAEDTLTFCEGNAVTIGAIEREGAYSWSDSTYNSSAVFYPLLSEYVYVNFHDSATDVIYRDSVWLDMQPTPTYSFEKTVECEYTELSVDRPGWDFNWSTGETSNYIQLTEPGLIYVEMTVSEFCILVDSIHVTETPFNIEKLSFQFEPGNCSSLGAILADTSKIEGGNAPYTLVYTNSDDGEQYETEHVFEEAPIGTYELEVSDGKCTAIYSQSIEFYETGNCESPKLTPDGDGFDDTFYIPETGTAVLYDKNGNRLHEFDTPTDWDGTDANGEILPVGSYMLIINESRHILITIIL